ncbi:MAG: acetyltransferase [Culicoidibacterales bacterium]
MVTTKKLIVIGAGGHAAVVIDLIKVINRIHPTWELVGCLDDGDVKACLGYPVLGKIQDINKYSNQCQFVIAIGNNHFRAQLAKQYEDAKFASLVHPSAIIGSEVVIAEGSVVLSQAVIHARTTIGKHTIVNTGAIVEHDNQIGDYVHLSPRATLCGAVTIGDLTQVGAGSTVIPGITIGAKIMIGAGSTVIQSCVHQGTYVGVPAKQIK